MGDEKTTVLQDISLEEAFKQLDQLIVKMQEADISLEEAFSLYKDGVTLVELCNSKIEKVECDIKLISDVQPQD